MIIDPQYLLIAKDIAKKIYAGEYKVDSLIKGRTVLSAEYGVSPETIRKSIHILEKDGVVHVKHGVGIIVKSKENAAKFLKKFEDNNSQKEKLDNLLELINERNKLNDEITKTINIMGKSKNLIVDDGLKFQEIVIRDDCWAINQTIGDIYFYNYTEATIVAIKRENRIITSPGPDFTFIAGDILVIIGKDELSYQRALTYLIYGASEE